MKIITTNNRTQEVRYQQQLIIPLLYMQYINHKRFVLVDVLFSVMQVNVHGVWVDGQAQQLHASASWTFRLVTFSC
jgi:hypothetical protein